MGRKGKKGRGSFTIPIAVVAGLGGGLVVPVQNAMAGDFAGAIAALQQGYTGYDSRDMSFDVNRLKMGLVPLFIGFAAHWAASKFGVNRALGRARVPVIRI